MVLALQPWQQATTARPAAVEFRRISRLDLPDAGRVLTQQYEAFLTPGTWSGTRWGIRGEASTGSCSVRDARPGVCNPAGHGTRNSACPAFEPALYWSSCAYAAPMWG
ncbi:hypothetical protein VaNZ11_016086 [Volvox africanus]|uniref:Uncharacterized protein n=1 Tax=Volvox africanus TaxID=51714 RepID=A0ABQ5SLW0_9CHLO|nr:hypothetical protein VaNZ11_016086 [Volvox africanus]